VTRSNWKPDSQFGAQAIQSLEIAIPDGETVVLNLQNGGWEYADLAWDAATDNSATLRLAGSNKKTPGDNDWVDHNTNDRIGPNKQISDRECAPFCWLRLQSTGGDSSFNMGYFGVVETFSSETGPTLSLTESAISIPNGQNFELPIYDYLDSDQSNPTFSGTSGDGAVFTSSTTGDVITITPVAPGTANLSISAANIAGGTSAVTIAVTVEAA